MTWRWRRFAKREKESTQRARVYSKDAETYAQNECRTFADRRRDEKEQLGGADSMTLLEEAAKQIEGKKEETEQHGDD